MGRRVLIVLSSIMLLNLSGCGYEVPMVQELSHMPEDAACRVALLPLIDKGSFPRGGTVFYKILLSELIASGHFRVIKEGDVLELYRQLKIYTNQQPNREQLEMIGGRLGSTIFIGGDILGMEERRDGEFLDAEITVVLRMYDGKSGREIWSTYHRRRGGDYQQVLHFGRINTMTSLAQQMTREIFTLWLKKGMKQCTD